MFYLHAAAVRHRPPHTTRGHHLPRRHSGHNHRYTSAYISPAVPTPRTTPPTPAPAPLRALPRLTAGLQRSNSPSQRSRSIQDTPCRRSPTPHRPDALKHPACTGPQRSNSPPQLAHAIQDTPLQPHAGPPLSRHLETLRLHKAPPRRRAQKNPALRAGPIHLSVIFSEKGRLHLAQTNALTQHNQSGAYPLINPCSHN